jgi:DnaJ-class molecular chaperone
MICPTCRGDGYTTRPTYCRVTGRERDEYTVCGECHGEGEVPETCISCGEPAQLKHEDGLYCTTCMKLHLLEKQFVQLTKLQRKQ